MINIYVGNLSFQTTQDDLTSIFSQYGAVERVNLVTDRMTGQPRGFAFVEMTNRKEGETAMATLNGSDLHGRTLSVNEARPKSDAPRGGGGFGGNRSGGRGGGGGGFKKSRW